MKTFIGLSVTAAVLTGILVVSCAPIPQDSSKGGNPHSQALASHPGSQLQPSEEAAVDGEWECASKEGCAYSSIKISAKDGQAVLNGDTEHAAKLAIGTNSETSLIQLNLSVIEDGSKISGSVNSKGSRNELVIGDDTYSRKPVQTAPANKS